MSADRCDTTKVEELRAIVVGAGIAGLTAAFRLKQAGAHVTVLEAGQQVGGRMSTVTENGYRFDIGAAGLSNKYHQMVKLAHDAGVGAEMIPTSDLLAIVRDGRMHHIRSHAPLDAARTKLLSWRGKLAAGKMMFDAHRIGDKLDWYELSRAAEYDVETVEGYGARRLNDEALYRLVDPLVRTIYLGNVDDVSIVDLLFALRNFFGGSFLNAETGIDFLCRGLARHVDVEFGARVTTVEEVAEGVHITWSDARRAEQLVDADVCVIALSAKQMADVHVGLAPDAKDLVADLTYADLMSVQIALQKPPGEPAMTISIPRGEHPDLCTITLDHNKAPGRVPPGRGLLNSYWDPSWVSRNIELDDAEIGALAVAGVSRILSGIEDDVEFTRVARFRPGVLLARPGTYSILGRLHGEYDRRSRIQLAGDYVGGSTTNSALCSGERAAARILEACTGGILE